MKIKTIILATRNAHKTSELRQMLGNSFEIKNLRDFKNVPETVEDAPTFAGKLYCTSCHELSATVFVVE